MILPIANILAGFLLAAPKLKEWFLKQHIESTEGTLNKFRAPIGIIILLLGIVGLIKRMSLFGIMYEWSWHYGSSFPQGIIAILMGLLLCANFFSKWPTLHVRIMGVSKYGEWLGILGILVALSALFD
jgi:hypothetical protein